MKLVHIADPHLGYRAYNRITPNGLNAREADVFAAFREALDRAATLEPDLVLIAGDLFHTVRPSNLIVNYSYRQFLVFRQKCSAPIVIIGGNHDTPRSVDTGCILDLLANLPSVYVVHGDYEQVRLDNLDTSVFCLCHRALPKLSSIRIEPDSESKYNILMAHGTVQGITRHAYDLYEIDRSQVINDAWDYVAFGHYHVFEKLAPNAFYAGSLEYTSNNIWLETKHKKGFIEYAIEERRLIAFHEVKTREVVDLRPIDAQDVSADQINRMIQHRIESIPGGHINKVIRLVVENIPRSVQSDLDFAMIRGIRSEALHFELQLRPPSKGSLEHSSSRLGTPKTLEEEWQEFAKVYNILCGVDRDRFLSLGRDYLVKQTQSEE